MRILMRAENINQNRETINQNRRTGGMRLHDLHPVHDSAITPAG